MKKYSLKRALLTEAPTPDQVQTFTQVLNKLFGANVELGQAHSVLVFKETTMHGDFVYTTAAPMSGRLATVTKPQGYHAHMSGSNSIAYSLLQNAEMQENIIMPIVKALYQKAGMISKFDTSFHTTDMPTSIDEKSELVRLREENKQLKEKIAELQAKLNGPSSNKPRGMNKGYEDLEI